MAWFKQCGGCGKRIEYTATCNCRKRVSNRSTESETDKLVKTSRWKKLRLMILSRDDSHCRDA